eukprot:2913736-Rhodomonas_salina.1
MATRSDTLARSRTSQVILLGLDAEKGARRREKERQRGDTPAWHAACAASASTNCTNAANEARADQCEQLAVQAKQAAVQSIASNRILWVYVGPRPLHLRQSARTRAELTAPTPTLRPLLTSLPSTNL